MITSAYVGLNLTSNSLLCPRTYRSSTDSLETVNNSGKRLWQLRQCSPISLSKIKLYTSTLVWLQVCKPREPNDIAIPAGNLRYLGETQSRSPSWWPPGFSSRYPQPVFTHENGMLKAFLLQPFVWNISLYFASMVSV